MMLAFIIFWIVVAVIVVAVAVRPRRGGDPGESRWAQRGITVGVIIVFAFGISVPALVMADNAEHKAHVGPGGIHLSDNEVKGRELFARSCVVCHTLAAVKSVGRIGPDLDVLVGHQIAPDRRKAFVLQTILEGPAYGLGNMPADLYVGKEAEDVAAFVAAVAGH
ncbi:MAG: c-type cytochrome [Solirubrobacteraceae bacterium]